MTLAEALAPTDHLSAFEGKQVRRAGIEIPGAAGGLREAMKVEPRQFLQGEQVFVVLECVVGKVRFDPIDKEEPGGDQTRVHVLVAEAATFVDESVVAEHLAAQKARIKRAHDAAAELQGQGQLPIAEELLAAHDAGEHAHERNDACPACVEEIDAEEAEAAEAAGQNGQG